MIGPIPEKQAMCIILWGVIQNKKMINLEKYGFTKDELPLSNRRLEKAQNIITRFCLKVGKLKTTKKNTKEMKALVKEFVQIG